MSMNQPVPMRSGSTRAQHQLSAISPQCFTHAPKDVHKESHDSLTRDGYKYSHSNGGEHTYVHREYGWARVGKHGITYQASKAAKHSDEVAGAKFGAGPPDVAHNEEAHKGLLKAGYKSIHESHGHTVYHHKEKGYAVLNRSAHYGSGHVTLHSGHDGHMHYNRDEVKEVFPK